VKYLIAELRSIRRAYENKGGPHPHGHNPQNRMMQYPRYNLNDEWMDNQEYDDPPRPRPQHNLKFPRNTVQSPLLNYNDVLKK